MPSRRRWQCGHTRRRRTRSGGRRRCHLLREPTICGCLAPYAGIRRDPWRRCTTSAVRHAADDASIPGFCQCALRIHLAGASCTRHRSAVSVASDAVVGLHVSVGAFSSIGRRARVGDRTIIYPNVCIGDDAVIGEDCVIHSQVAIRERVIIGNRVVIQNGAVDWRRRLRLRPPSRRDPSEDSPGEHRGHRRRR